MAGLPWDSSLFHLILAKSGLLHYRPRIGHLFFLIFLLFMINFLVNFGLLFPVFVLFEGIVTLRNIIDKTLLFHVVYWLI